MTVRRAAMQPCHPVLACYLVKEQTELFRKVNLKNLHRGEKSVKINPEGTGKSSTRKAREDLMIFCPATPEEDRKPELYLTAL